MALPIVADGRAGSVENGMDFRKPFPFGIAVLHLIITAHPTHGKLHLRGRATQDRQKQQQHSKTNAVRKKKHFRST
jgi:hypothetical protein